MTAIGQGAYELQDPTLKELFAWVKSSSYKMSGEFYYQYLNTPDRPSSESTESKSCYLKSTLQKSCAFKD